ncbi:hypothetical protein POF45_26750 [Pseudomonas sp. 681]|uniref:Uncharacterized protein n=1 Tax=Pseudomonas fungipugnans TaxID=3024217 RepID=A0ABT6QVQ5_9PSED|nr:hypothetical protein [Pseudomonas sp. 681]MDI2594995.1 hypothetical protein [Pseudomonas sp. 681]
MNGNCVAILAPNHKALYEALKNQGFFMVADLAKRISVEVTARGMLIARPSK